MQQLFAFRRALDPGWIGEFSDVRIFKRDPLNPSEVDAVILLQEAPHPRAGRLRIGTNTYFAALQIAGIEMTAFAVVKNCMMLVTSYNHGGHQNVRLAVRFRLQGCNDGQLGQIEFLLPHHRLEQCVDGFDLGKNEIDDRRPQFAISQRDRVWVRRQECLESESSPRFKHRFHHLLASQCGIERLSSLRKDPIAIFSAQNR